MVREAVFFFCESVICTFLATHREGTTCSGRYSSLFVLFISEVASLFLCVYYVVFMLCLLCFILFLFPFSSEYDVTCAWFVTKV